MLRTTFLLLCLLSVFPATSCPAFGVRADEPIAEVPRFSPGNPAPFVEWVRQSLTFSDDLFPEGEEAYVAVRFKVTKEGEMKDIELVEATKQVYADKILAVLGRGVAWNPPMRDGHAVEGALEIGVEFLLVRRVADGTLFAANPETYMLTERMPKFQNGDLNTFRDWVMQHVEYPERALQAGIQGIVAVSFVVEPDGSLARIRILQTPDPWLSQAVCRVLAKSPKWTPGMQAGEIVPVSYTLPVQFREPGPSPVAQEEVPGFRF